MATEKKKLIFNPITGQFDTIVDVTDLAESADLNDYQLLSEKGSANGYAPLDNGGKVPIANLPNSVMQYQGQYNASTNTPTLADGTGNTGDVYEVIVAGSQNLGSGSISFNIGDWVVYNGTVWQKSINSNEVVSVNGLTGAVTLDTDDIAEGSKLYYTATRFNTAFSAKSTDDLSEGVTNLYYTNARAKAATVSDAIVDGVIDVAPSQNAVFDAVALKANTDLGNLTATSINQPLVPDTDVSKSLGTTLRRWTTLNIQKIQNQAANLLVLTNGALTDFTTNGTIASWTGNKLTIGANKLLSWANSLGNEISFSASNTAATQAYVLPEAVPAADGQILSSTTSGDLSWTSLPSSGVINLISNGSADSTNSSIFVPYADGAVQYPIDGIGGSPIVTTSISSVSPLAGTKSYVLTKPFGSAQGNGWAIDNIPLDLAYRAKSLKISFAYLVDNTGGGFFPGFNGASPDNGSVICTFYDITNSKLVEPSNIKLLSNSSTTSDVYEATVQFDSNCTSVRFILHNRLSLVDDYSIKLDNILLSPQVYVYGTPVTDWIEYTPTTAGFGTITTSKFLYRRNGDSIDIQGRFTAGTTTATIAEISLPNGFRTDSIKGLPGYRNYGTLAYNGTSGQILHSILNENSTVVNFSNAASGSGLGLTRLNGSQVASASVEVSFTAYGIPIQGQSSSVRVSDNYDGRELTLRMGKVGASQSLTNATLTKITFDSTIQSKGLVWDSVNSRVVCVSTGTYFGEASLQFGTSGVYTGLVRVLKNGVSIFEGRSYVPSGINAQPFVGFRVDLNVGDYLEVFGFQNSGGALGVANDAIATFFNVSKLMAPQTIAASEKIRAIYKTGAGQSLGTGVVILNYATKDDDTHGAVTTGASWKFTAPRAMTVSITGASRVSTASRRLDLYKNGVFHKVINEVGVDATSAVATSVSLLAGEYFDIRVNSGSAASLFADDKFNYITIVEV
jgi:hypothetical protein